MRRLSPGLITSLLATAAALFAAAPANAASPANDPFYRYTGTTPLEQIAPGTVLATRLKPYHAAGIQIGLQAVQLLYRTTGMRGQPTVNVTSVVLPPWGPRTAKVITYGSAYDSLSVADEPSYAIAGGTTFGSLAASGETALIAPFLLQGYTVVVPDTEGQGPDFAAGPEYGMATLDALRASIASPNTGIHSDAKIGLLGYSGGAIAAEWAAELGPSYAPDINKQLVGAAFGGVLVSPAHNLHYIDGSKTWAGVAAMAIIGASRAFDVDLKPYLSPYGLRIIRKLNRAPITSVLGQYPGLTWAKMAKPEFATPESVPVYVHLVNQLIMGSRGTPTVPMFIGQGANGEAEGTPGDTPGIGKGDGVMIAGDVRTLARQFCGAGAMVFYRQYDSLSHTGALRPWLPTAVKWIQQRFTSAAAPQNCADIAPGNSLAPIPE